jgi:hypothetical protein
MSWIESSNRRIAGPGVPGGDGKGCGGNLIVAEAAMAEDSGEELSHKGRIRFDVQWSVVVGKTVSVHWILSPRLMRKRAKEDRPGPARPRRMESYE